MDAVTLRARVHVLKKFKVSGRAACAVIGQLTSGACLFYTSLWSGVLTHQLLRHIFYLSWIFDAIIVIYICVFPILETTRYCI